MGCFNSDRPGHEGYVVGLVPVEKRAARARWSALLRSRESGCVSSEASL
jgi:hypothetical protein